jgi:fatty acid desaturase
MGSTFGDFVLVTICASIQGGPSSSVNHELCHRRNKYLKFLGLVSNMKILSGQAHIEHNEMHHKHTGIPIKDSGYTPRTNTIYDAFDPLGYHMKMITFKYDD